MVPYTNMPSQKRKLVPEERSPVFRSNTNTRVNTTWRRTGKSTIKYKSSCRNRYGHKHTKICEAAGIRRKQAHPQNNEHSTSHTQSYKSVHHN